MPHAFEQSAPLTERLGDDCLSLQELAHACRRAPEWVSEHVSEGVLAPEPAARVAPDTGTVVLRFASTTLVRARRVSELEGCFDADPHLAALAVDLIEEVSELRRQLTQLRAASDAPGLELIRK